MEFEDLGQFDDPALKGALRRTIGKQTAPAEFRERMQQMLGASSVPTPRSMSRARSLFLGFAAAAVVLLSVALVAVQIKNYVLTPTAAAPASLPDTLASSLITTHDKCLAAADHHIISATDSAALATTLTNDLGFKVTIPVASEWTFKGAGECRVGNHRSAHLLYSRGQTNVSVFALPTEAIQSCGSSSYYETLSNKHPIIGYASSNSLYALVGSDTSHDLTMTEMQGIASQFQGCGPSGCGASATVAVIAH